MVYNYYTIPNALLKVIADYFVGGYMEILTRGYHPNRDGDVRNEDALYPPTINSDGDTLSNPIGAWSYEKIAGIFYFSDAVLEPTKNIHADSIQQGIFGTWEARQEIKVNNYIRISHPGLPRVVRFYNSSGTLCAWTYAVGADARLPQHPEVVVIKGIENDFESFLLEGNDLIVVDTFEYIIYPVVIYTY
ncbi:MAG: hypothetical protein KZQ59_12170 [Candidatus Thiodiazotropha sp. (ex Lucinoma aequizonata)]|nr:hypothetical protein [Candidatus Thiodiazotropha sp. (ex Lucinoma aequizonata)]